MFRGACYGAIFSIGHTARSVTSTPMYDMVLASLSCWQQQIITKTVHYIG